MSTKLYDCMVAVSKYNDQNGNTKTKWENIGAIWQNTDKNGNTYETLMLKRTFNPAGLDAKEGADSVRVSLFKPKPPQGQNGQQGQQQGYNPQTSQSFGNGGFGNNAQGGGFNQQPQQQSGFGEPISDMPF